MKINDVKKGQWYLIENYGFLSLIKGKVVDITGEYVTLKFYWGGIFRSRYVVHVSRLVGECERPGWFSNY